MVVYLKCASPQSSAVQHQPACASLGYGVSPGRDGCMDKQRDRKGKERGARAHGLRDGSSLLDSSSTPPNFPSFACPTPIFSSFFLGTGKIRDLKRDF